MIMLYIDPGTGSMLFSLAIGVATTLVFAGRALAVKLRFILSGGKAAKISANKIPYVIFSDHKRYWNVFKPICDEFEKRKIPLVYYTQSPDDPALDEKYEFVKAEFIGEGNKGFVKMNMLNAGTVLATTPDLDVTQWKRSKNVDRYVHIPHSVDDKIGYRMFGIDYYDAVLLTGEFQKEDIREIETLRNLPQKDLVVVGSTYMDAAEKRIKTFEKHKTDFENPVVLVAPSWSENAILSKYGENFLDSLIATGFKIIVRPHPQSKIAEKEMLLRLEEKYKDKIEWNYDNDNLAVLNRADLMITDFSAIIFDYTFLFGRPLIYANADFDTAIYDAAWIERPQWRLRILPKLGIPLRREDFPNLKEVIQKALSSEELEEGRKTAKNDAWQNMGNAAKAVVDYMTQAEGSKD